MRGHLPTSECCHYTTVKRHSGRVLPWGLLNAWKVAVITGTYTSINCVSHGPLKAVGIAELIGK